MGTECKKSAPLASEALDLVVRNQSTATEADRPEQREIGEALEMPG
jgi:hypothetical protein